MLNRGDRENESGRVQHDNNFRASSCAGYFIINRKSVTQEAKKPPSMPGERNSQFSIRGKACARREPSPDWRGGGSRCEAMERKRNPAKRGMQVDKWRLHAPCLVGRGHSAPKNLFLLYGLFENTSEVFDVVDKRNVCQNHADCEETVANKIHD